MPLTGMGRPRRVGDAKPTPAPSLSIVVQPFANLGGDDPEQEYFVDGVTESLTTDLSGMVGSFVIGRSTAFTYNGKHVDSKGVSQQLGARYVHEGSVQRSGNRMRVNVQLIDRETGNHLWAERFDPPLLRPLRLPASTLSEFPTKLQQPSFHRYRRGLPRHGERSAPG
jgi:TolB-like protein